MKKNYTKSLRILAAGMLTMLSSIAFATSTTGLIISEFLANPPGRDSSSEFVELKVTKYIDFSATPYCVVWCNNGTATANGWVSGTTISYGFNITSGVVNAGDVVYVGGTGMSPTGVKIRFIDCGSVAGDRFGTALATGVMGNGGTNADGIAVFDMDISLITVTSIPIDAIFYGTAAGTAVVSAGTAGYVLPVNDMYPGGYLQTTNFIGPDPGSGIAVWATGTYDTLLNTYSTARTWDTSHVITDGVSFINLLSPSVGITSTENTSGINVYPNPFKEQTSLELKLTSSEKVKSEIYNALGEKVETIADGVFSAGVHLLSYNAKQINQPAGIYFIKTTIGDSITVKRIIQK